MNSALDGKVCNYKEILENLLAPYSRILTMDSKGSYQLINDINLNGKALIDDFFYNQKPGIHILIICIQSYDLRDRIQNILPHIFNSSTRKSIDINQINDNDNDIYYAYTVLPICPHYQIIQECSNSISKVYSNRKLLETLNGIDPKSFSEKTQIKPTAELITNTWNDAQPENYIPEVRIVAFTNQLTFESYQNNNLPCPKQIEYVISIDVQNYELQNNEKAFEKGHNLSIETVNNHQEKSESDDIAKTESNEIKHTVQTDNSKTNDEHDSPNPGTGIDNQTPRPDNEHTEGNEHVNSAKDDNYIHKQNYSEIRESGERENDE